MSDFFQKNRARIAFAGPHQCWLWLAGKSSGGYGTVYARGKNRSAHREAYEAEHGAGSADGLVVRHKCDVPACVNPAHLELGTHADNVRDMDERGRRGNNKGEAHGLSKLTEEDVRTIRAVYNRGRRGFGQYALARRFGVSRTTVSRIVDRKYWTHVEQPAVSKAEAERLAHRLFPNPANDGETT